MPLNTAEKFWSRTKKNEVTGCIEWTAGTFKSGYGSFSIGNIRKKSHRLSYEWHYGSIDNSLCVLHACDNRKCVNPDHLFQGTRKDNNLDKTSKGRQTKGCAVNTAKLDEKAVSEIRESDKTSKELAEIHGVTWGHINKVKNARSWNHV